MDLNIRLLILDLNQEHAAGIAEKLQSIIPFVTYETCHSVEDALQAHLENPFQICILTASIRESDAEIFLKDMQKLYATNHDKLCTFISVKPDLPPNFDLAPSLAMGLSTVVSENFDKSDHEKLKNSLQEYLHFKKISENIGDLDWTMKLVLAEVDRVSNERKRGRETKFNTIASDFVSNMVEFDAKVLSKYFDALSEETEKSSPQQAQYIRIPKEVLSRKLPKLLESRYTGASSRVWKKLLDKYGVKETQ